MPFERSECLSLHYIRAAHFVAGLSTVGCVQLAMFDYFSDSNNKNTNTTSLVCDMAL